MAPGQHVLDFSPDGKLFALINEQGILRIWDTETNELKQEYTPNLHLSGPCTSLTWVTASTATSTGKPKKARKSIDAGKETLYIALGTSTGNVSLYSYAQGKIERNLKGDGHAGKITDITKDSKGQLYTCGLDGKLITWSLAEQRQMQMWSVGPEKPYSVAYLPESRSLVLGARKIKVYSASTQELLQTFTGHNSDISLMSTFSVSAAEGETEQIEYVLSTSRMDRIICLWKVDRKGLNNTPACTLLMEDIAHCLCCQLVTDSDGGRQLRVASVTRSGVIHVYLLPLDSIKASKPIKPKVTIEIASDSVSVIEPIPAVAAALQHSGPTEEILFGYGDKRFLVFERLVPSYAEKMQVLIRAEPKKLYMSKAAGKKADGSAAAMKTLTPIINAADVDYKSTLNVTKKKVKAVELPMEARLENLNLNTPTATAPQAQSKAKLLTQALHSKDAALLRTVLATNDLKVIQLTLQRLPVQYVGPLVNELTLLMQQKRVNVEYSIKWLKSLCQIHASQLMALGSDDLMNKFGPCIGIIEHRANCLKEISKLHGRLQLLVSQIKRNVDEENLNSEHVLVYDDNDSSDSEIENNAEKNTSEDEWDENDDDDNEEGDDNDGDDDDEKAEKMDEDDEDDNDDDDDDDDDDSMHS